MQKRFMGLDFGKARIGVAFSNLSVASASHIYNSKTETENLAYFSELIKTENVCLVVFGLPLQTDGTEGEMCKFVRSFAEKLHSKTGVQVAFQDERYTSYEADELLKEAGFSWEKRKELLDKVSAQIILQNFMDANPQI